MRRVHEVPIHFIKKKYCSTLVIEFDFYVAFWVLFTDCALMLILVLSKHKQDPNTLNVSLTNANGTEMCVQNKSKH